MNINGKELDETIDALAVFGISQGGYSDEELERMEAEEHEKAKQESFKKSGIGAKYLNKRLSDFNAYNDELKQILATVEKFIADFLQGIKRSLWLIGKNGNGKTFLGAMIVRECGGKFVESSVIEDEIEETKHFNAKETITGLRARYAGYKLLVIDEVGRFPSDNEKKYLFKILNDRYNEDRPTVLISNMSREALMDYIGYGLTDRFVESCTSVTFNSESYRSQERKERIK